MNSIEVNNLTKKFGNFTAVDNIFFNVREGEVFGFLGANGTEKSTAIRMLCGILNPTSGDAMVGGYSVMNEPDKVKKVIGYMSQKFSLYNDLSVEENINFFAAVFGTTLQENYELVKDIYQQIEPFKKRPAGKLSGGMKQKLALSCALIHKPRFLVLDEPTTGVDAISRSEFWEMLQKLTGAGITILVSTPYMDEASLCNRVALIQKGEILDVASPRQIVEGFKGLLFGVSGGNMYHLIRQCRTFEKVASVYPFGEELQYRFISIYLDKFFLK